MRAVLTFSFLLFIIFEGLSQEKTVFKNSIGVSIPLIWNISKADNKLLGVTSAESGSAVSYGVNVNYARNVLKHIFFIAGIGVYRQCFGIKRKCNFDVNGSALLYSTSYSYLCTHYKLGIGYAKSLQKNMLLNASINFNNLQSFKQKYIHKKGTLEQVNNKAMRAGQIFDSSIGLEKEITKHFGVGGALVVPIITIWKTDSMFHDDKKIARTISSAGIALSLKYHF